MKLSVIVPSYNNLPKILRCINSLQLTAFSPVEYIIQDDCSPEYDLRPLIPQSVATTFRNEQNLGFPGNCNAGAVNATGDILFFVNQDCFAVTDWSTGWDAPLLDMFEGHPKIAVIGARLLFPNGSIQSAGGSIDARGTPYHRCLGYSDPHYHEVSTPQEVDWVTGGAFAVRRSAWEALGGFDTGYERGYFEDADFCLSAREAGHVVWYEPYCTLIHEVGSTGGNPVFHKNALRFKAKWLDSGRLRPTEAVVKERFW